MALRLAVLVLAGLLYLGRQWLEKPSGSSASGSGQQETQSSETNLREVYAGRISDVMVLVEGEVERTLSDDNQGSRHQRFIVRSDSGITVLVAHNIDLAKRVPLRESDRVEVFGEYEWNDRGGVLHWTHHDPQGRRSGGWIRHQGREYR